MFTRAVLMLGIAANFAACSSGSSSKGGAGGTTTTGTESTATGGSTSTSDAATSSSGGTSSTDGTTSSGTGGASGAGATDSSVVPADDSVESITAFLESDGYKQEGWVAAQDVPRTPDAMSASPHGMVRVYLSPQVVAFKQQEPDASVSPEVPGAMAVKEFYDDPAGSPLGHAVMFYAQDSWTYYCYGPANRCAAGSPETTSADPEYGNITDCFFCHGGNIYTALP